MSINHVIIISSSLREEISKERKAYSCSADGRSNKLVIAHNAANLAKSSGSRVAVLAEPHILVSKIPEELRVRCGP